MSKQPTPEEVIDTYRESVEALPTDQLLQMVRGQGFAPRTPQYIVKPLKRLASQVAQQRGIELPEFAAFFVT